MKGKCPICGLEFTKRLELHLMAKHLQWYAWKSSIGVGVTIEKVRYTSKHRTYCLCWCGSPEYSEIGLLYHLEANGGPDLHWRSCLMGVE